MRATVITSVMFSLYGLAVTGVEGVATIDRGNTVELTPGMTSGHLAVHRGPSPGVIDPSLDPLLDSTNDNTGDWLDVPDAIQWGYINDNHEAHGLVDVVWAFEGVPSFDGHKYNFLSQYTLHLLELLATVNADLPQPPNLPGQDPNASPNNARHQIQSSLTGRATTYACTTKFQPRRAELRLPRRQGHPRSQPVWLFNIDNNNRWSTPRALDGLRRSPTR